MKTSFARKPVWIEHHVQFISCPPLSFGIAIARLSTWYENGDFFVPRIPRSSHNQVEAFPLLSPPSTPPKIPQITRNICNIFLERTALPQLDKQTAAATPAYPRLVAYEGQSGASNIFSANPGSTMVSFVLSFSFSLFLSVRAV